MAQIIQLESAGAAKPLPAARQYSDVAIRTDAVHVVFTSIEETFVAVRVAGDFAKALSVPVTLTQFRTVPYVLPVHEPTGMAHTSEHKERSHA